MRARPSTRRREARRDRKRSVPAALALTLVAIAIPQLTLAPAIAGGPATDASRASAHVERTGTPGIFRSLVQEPVTLRSHRALADRPISQVATADATQAASFQAALHAARETALSYGVTFAVVRGGKLLWAGGSGTTSDEKAAALDGNSPLVIGSITKTFVAATVLELVDEGRVRLSDPVRTHLRDAPISEDVTVRQLLDHTSGLADVYNDTTANAIQTEPERAWSTNELMANLHAPWYEPGQDWAYANTNYLLLGLLIERVTGESLADELASRFLGPLRLRDTRMLTPTDAGPLSPAWTTVFWSSGAMASSAVDLARWGEALYHGSIVSPQSRTAMTVFNEEDYGLGTQRIPMPGGIGYGHTGLLNTYTAMLVHVPSQDVTFAIIVNRGRAELGPMLTAEGPDGFSLLELATGRTDPIAVPGPTTP